MGRGVVADQMAFGDHALDQIGRAFNIVADHKEAGGRLMLFQRIQNGCRVAAFIPGIEGEVYDRLGGIADIIGIVFFQGFGRGIANRRRAFGLEGKPPVGHRCGNGGRRGMQHMQNHRAAQHQGKRTADELPFSRPMEVGMQKFQNQSPPHRVCFNVCTKRA